MLDNRTNDRGGVLDFYFLKKDDMGLAGGLVHRRAGPNPKVNNLTLTYTR